MRNLTINIIVLLCCSYANAQLAATNNGNLQVHTGANLSFFGGFTNASTAAFVNNGNTYVKATLTNHQSSMSAGTGTLYMNGSSAQSVEGTQAFRTNHLNTDNANGITLNNHLRVSGTHTFTSGIITTSSTPHYLVYEAGAGYSGTSDARHVNGWVKKLGNTSFSFPVGNGTYLRPIAISNLSGVLEFNAVHSGATPNTSNLQSPLVHMNPNEHWTLNQVTAGSAQVTLNWDHSKIAFPRYALADIRSAQYTGGLWTSTGGAASGDVTTTGSITSSSLSTFGLMAIGSESAVLPLRLQAMTATRMKDYTLIEWKTTNEERVSHHEVQRSLPNSSFITIGQVAARNRHELQTYQYKDRDSLTGTIFYRIKSVDMDGRISFSKTVAITIGAAETLKLLQNPVQTNIVLSTSGRQASVYQYQLMTTEGKSVQSGTINYSGTGVISIPLKPSLPAATYVLFINNKKVTQNIKVVTQ